MRSAHLKEMVKGWFIGDFAPTLYKTQVVEVAVKNYLAGDAESSHYHKISTEFTVVTQGVISMNNERYGPGDIIIIEPGDVTNFIALTDATTTVVKIPGAAQDKYHA
jgi:quercetin dioxygenase-like cupin family protein